MLRITLWGYQSDIYNLTESPKCFLKPKYTRWANYHKKRDQIIKLEEQYWQLSGEKLLKLYGFGF